MTSRPASRPDPTSVGSGRGPAAVFLMGVSGAGKSTVGALLADQLGGRFLDADDLHPEANRRKMAEGTALTDEDRQPWLAAVAAAAERAADRGTVVVACSALRRSYRDVLTAGVSGAACFIHLTSPRTVIAERLRQRTVHFMPASLLDSQLATLEPLGEDETGFRCDVDPDPNVTVERALAGLAADVRDRSA